MILLLQKNSIQLVLIPVVGYQEFEVKPVLQQSVLRNVIICHGFLEEADFV